MRLRPGGCPLHAWGPSGVPPGLGRSFAAGHGLAEELDLSVHQRTLQGVDFHGEYPSSSSLLLARASQSWCSSAYFTHFLFCFFFFQCQRRLRLRLREMAREALSLLQPALAPAVTAGECEECVLKMAQASLPSGRKCDGNARNFTVRSAIRFFFFGFRFSVRARVLGSVPWSFLWVIGRYVPVFSVVSRYPLLTVFSVFFFLFQSVTSRSRLLQRT